MHADQMRTIFNAKTSQSGAIRNMKDPLVRLEYTSVGCNRVVDSLDWSRDTSLIAFCAHKAFIVYDTSKAAIVRSVIGHNERVNCIKWIPNKSIGAGHGA